MHRRPSLIVGLIPILILIAPPRTIRADEPEAVREAVRYLEREGISTDTPSVLRIFRDREMKADLEKLDLFVQNLGARSYRKRHRASQQLTSIGASAVSALLRARFSKDLEVSRRARDCLQVISAQAKPQLVSAAATILAERKPEGAVEAMLNALPTILGEEAILTIHQALTKLAEEDDKPHPALVKGLESPYSATRAGAGVALCRIDAKEHMPAIRKLLKDPEPYTRLHIGLALVDRHEKDVVPELIRLCEILPRSQGWRVEDLLYRMAKEDAPDDPLLGGEKERQAFVKAWSRWWQANRGKVDLREVTQEPGYLGYTLIVLLDEGLVYELDEKGNKRFELKNTDFPLDAQMVPGERILLAEHGSNRIVERHRSGRVLWEYKIVEPIVAQRISGGRTFICSKDRMVIVDRSGRETFSYSQPHGETFMRARWLPNGDIICVSSYSRCMRMNANGKILHTFSVNVGTYGGRIDILPNGNILIPEMYSDRVVEYTPQGRTDRVLRVSRPIVAERLPNGNTMVTCMEEKRAVELDKDNKEVWEHKHTTRVTRAVRR